MRLRLSRALRFAIPAMGRALLVALCALALVWLALRQPWPFLIRDRSFLAYVAAEERRMEQSADDRIRQLASTPVDLPLDRSPTGLWQLRAIRAQEAWGALELRWAGRESERPRVRVGVYDGAMATAHPDLFPNLDDDDPADPFSVLAAWLAGAGHGAGMMGIIGGAGAPGMTGAAPRSILIPFHTVRSGRDTSLSAALAHFRSRGVRVANFAIAIPEPIGPASAVKQAADGGLLVVTGLYNRDTDTPAYPAAYPGVLTASGVSLQDEPAGFGWGDLVDVVAPAWGMPTTAAMLRAGPFGFGPPYRRQCCNSVASALATGTAALILEADPTLTSTQVEKRIKLSARKPSAMMDAQGRTLRWHPRFGYGVLDAYAAVTFDRIGPNLQTSVSPESRDALIVTGTAVDDVLDDALEPSRTRDDHLRGVPTSNIAMVEYRTRQSDWQAASLQTAAASAGQYARAFNIRIEGAVIGQGGMVEIRAGDTAGNVSPSVSIPVIGRRE